MTFSLDADGNVDRITMKAVSPLADFSYDYHDLLFTPGQGGEMSHRASDAGRGRGGRASYVSRDARLSCR